jgi:hypothetical protein
MQNEELSNVHAPFTILNSQFFILVFFLVLCLINNLALPLFEASDEASHFRYAHYLASERRLPDLTRDLPSHEVTQPVLYYALVALVISPFNRANLDAISQLNPDWFDKELNADYKSVKSLHVHTNDEQWPWRGAVWAVRAARWVSSLLGALVVLLVYQIAKSLNLQSPIPSLSAALVAFNPKFIHISSIVSNDVAITLAATAACWWMVRLAQRPAFMRDRKGWFALGLLCGVAVLCKLSGVGLLAPVGVLVLIGLRAGEVSGASWASVGKAVLAFLMGYALATGWWFAFNTVSYGNPLAWEQVRAANAALLRMPPLTIFEIVASLPRVLESYWGVVGIELDFPRWVNWVFFAVLVVAFVGCIVIASHRNLPRATYLLLAWQLALSALFVLWLRGYVGTENGRLIMPGVAGVALAVAVGWMALVPERWRKPVAFTSACGLFALALATPFWVVRPAFAEPSYLTAQQVAALPTQNGPTFGGDVMLLHAQVGQRSVRPGEAMRVRLVWGAVRPIGQSYRVILEALDLNGDVIGRTYAIPFGGRFATQRWAVGQFFEDDYEVAINTDVGRGAADTRRGAADTRRGAADTRRGAAAIKLSLFAQYPEAHVLKLDGTDANTLEIGKIKIDAKAIALSDATGTALPQRVNFGDTVELSHIDVSRGLMTWRCLRTPDRDYTLFVHVLDAQGKLIWQSDGQPLGGRYPTRLWDANDVIEETREINLQNAQRVLIGWYDAQTGERLPAMKADGTRWQDDAVIIWDAS